jgi:hypothetical protein
MDKAHLCEIRTAVQQLIVCSMGATPAAHAPLLRRLQAHKACMHYQYYANDCARTMQHSQLLELPFFADCSTRDTQRLEVRTQ